jgi:hypothetical protein
MQDAAANNGAKNNGKADESANRQTALHLCYGEIGISAVAAAVRYQGGAKNAEYAPVAIRPDGRETLG